jgi:endonuclease-8
MPEGDTIFRAARTLHRALTGKVVTRFETQLPQLSRVDYDTPIVGRIIETVEPVGKWMHIRFSGDLTLLTHMLMSGSWHIYRPGETWQRPRHHMRVAIYTDEFVAVAFNVQVAEFHTAESLRRHPGLQRLGPDVLGADFDQKKAAQRLKAAPQLETGVALLTQSIVAGVGNIFKSEVCFASCVNPFRRIASLRDDEIESLIHNARAFLRANVTEIPAGRQTTGRSNPAGRYWVYKRAGEPCRKCGAPINSQKQGLDARVTFWCQRCQPA